jgi:hypothetical protein
MIKIMKKLLYISFLALVAVFFIQCDAEEDLMTENAKEGGMVDLSATALNYVVGSTTPYSFDMYVHQEKGSKITQIDLYKSCYKVAVPWSSPDSSSAATDSIDAQWSNEVLEQTIAVTELTANSSVSSDDWLYADLRANLTFTGDDPSLVSGALPATDGEMRIGDYFNFRVVVTMDDGRVLQQEDPVKMTVATRYAGDYACTFAEYYRIGVLTYTTGDWPAITQIESVDAITYRVLEYFGAFNGNEWLFQIIDGKISYPDGQTGNDQPMITCESNPGDMTNVPCDASTNIVVNDDVEGKDQLIMTFGYYTSGSGSREFYQVMEKIPN